MDQLSKIPKEPRVASNKNTSVSNNVSMPVSAEVVKLRRLTENKLKAE